MAELFLAQNETGLRFAHVLTSQEELKDKPIALMHAHKSYEIYYLVSGDVTYTISDKEYKIKPGSIVILNAYVLHKVNVNAGEDYERYVLECPFINIPTYNGINPLNRFFNTNDFVHVIPPKFVETSNIVDRLKTIVSEYDANDEYNNHILIANIINYVVEIAKLVGEEQKISYNFVKNVEKNSDIINKIIQFINDNINKKISIDTIADEMNFCKSYIQHLFRDSIGVPISKYIIIQKMQTANFLLEEGKTLKEVATELGYKYYPTFFSAYKKFFGFCPKEKKQKLK